MAPDEGYTVAMKPEDAAILVTGSSEPKITVTVTLTSPVVRESMIAESSGGKYYHVLYILVHNDTRRIHWGLLSVTTAAPI